MKQRFCPNCGSFDVGPDTSRTNVLGEMMFDNDKWLCNECGYRGIMPEAYEDKEEEVEYDEEKIEFEQKDQETVDKNAGKAYFKYVFYIILPLTVLYILYIKII